MRTDKIRSKVRFKVLTHFSLTQNHLVLFGIKVYQACVPYVNTEKTLATCCMSVQGYFQFGVESVIVCS